MSRAELIALLASVATQSAEVQEAYDRALLAAADDNATLTEMGAAMGINRQTVRGRIRAARRRLEAKPDSTSETEGN